MNKHILEILLLTGLCSVCLAENKEKLKTETDILPPPSHRMRKWWPDAKGFGGAGGLAPLVLQLDKTPIEEILESETDLRDKSFDFDDEEMLLVGGMGYGGRKNGGRVGAGGWFGYTKLTSDKYSGRLTDSLDILNNDGDSIVDSVAHLHVLLPFGGVIAEKGISFPFVNIFAGGMWGGGALIARKTFRPYRGGTAFTRYDDWDVDSEEDPDDIAEKMGEWAAAPLMVFDLHAGGTWSFTSWMQVGADAFMLWFYSAEGFGAGYNPIRTANRGVRIRLLFGNLG